MVDFSSKLGSGMRFFLDFALPPRCAGCGTIVDEMHRLCADCWTGVHWLGDTGCSTCGLPLEATEADECGRCLADPPPITRTRAAMEYGEVARSLVMKLKYGRKVGSAATMASFIAPLAEASAGAILVPVPLHRTRLWSRGFNQSALIARQLAPRIGAEHRTDLIERTRQTAKLKGMSVRQRRREVRGAFSLRDRSAVAGRHLILIDDVLTSGSTSEACARTLLKGGAERVDLLCFARVVRPVSFER